LLAGSFGPVSLISDGARTARLSVGWMIGSEGRQDWLRQHLSGSHWEDSP